MRKLDTPNKTVTLHIRPALLERLDNYMLDYIGKAYGRNAIISDAITEYLDKRLNKKQNRNH